MNISELATALATEQRLPPARARKVLDTVFGKLADAMVAGDDVVIPGFGRFALRAHDAMERKAPDTGEIVQIPAGRRPVFTPAKQIRDRVNAVD